MMNQIRMFRRCFSVQTKSRHDVLEIVDIFRTGKSHFPDSLKDGVRAEVDTNLNIISRSKLSELLVAGAYADVLNQNQYEKILSHLSRTEPMKAETPFILEQIKTFEIMLRCGLIPSSTYSDFSNYSTKFLLRMRSKILESQSSQSAMFNEVNELSNAIAQEYFENISVGPYRLNFIQIGEAGISDPSSKSLVTPETKLLLKKYVCLNVIERNEFVDADLKPQARIRMAVVNALAKKPVHVPYKDWEQLGDHPEKKKLYLTQLVSERQLD